MGCSKSLSEVTKAILGACDIAFVPCQPSGLDVSSSHKILQIIRHIQKMRGGKPQAGLFLSRAVKNTLQLREAQELLSSDPRFLLLNSIVYQRQCLSDPPATAFELSDPSAKAAVKDYNNLFSEALKLG
ncbi:hypothetical protein L8106_22456 [Lyngbya sp. PCC 8106]|nr:hypothetical protein L8106_22456 [Lyngbya sp. PCC 8106]